MSCFQQVLVRGVRDLQFVDERECRYIFTAVENLGKLVLEVADIGLEVITLPYFDGEEVVVLLGLPTERIV